jgi:hypothetical protein
MIDHLVQQIPHQVRKGFARCCGVKHIIIEITGINDGFAFLEIFGLPLRQCIHITALPNSRQYVFGHNSIVPHPVGIKHVAEHLQTPGRQLRFILNDYINESCIAIIVVFEKLQKEGTHENAFNAK